jgi:hypothetical protein
LLIVTILDVRQPRYISAQNIKSNDCVFRASRTHFKLVMERLLIFITIHYHLFSVFA